MVNLVEYYNAKFDFDNDSQNLYKALGAFYEALKIFTIKNYPIYYACAQRGIEESYTQLSSVENTKENLNKAEAAIKEAEKAGSI